MSGILNAIVGAGMGLALQDRNDERQRNQEWHLMRQNMEGQKEMYDYQMQKQYEMWLKTNYSAQARELEKAGLNKALMYGMGGGGGATVGGGAPSVPTGSGPRGGGEIQDMIGMGLQLDMQRAQTDLLKAQAENIRTDTKKKGGVDTENVAMQTEKLFQEWQNLKQTHTLQGLEIALKNIQNFEQQTSQENRLKYIETQTKTALHNLNIVKNENKISDDTVNDQIKTIKQEAIFSVLKNALTRAQINKTGSDINVNNAQMRKMSHDIMTNWENLERKDRDLMLKQLGVSESNDISESIDRILGIIF